MGQWANYCRLFALSDDKGSLLWTIICILDLPTSSDFYQFIIHYHIFTSEGGQRKFFLFSISLYIIILKQYRSVEDERRESGG